jgi:hypothetical protein
LNTNFSNESEYKSNNSTFVIQPSVLIENRPTFSELTNVLSLERSTIKVNNYVLEKNLLDALSNGNWIHYLTIEAYLSFFATIDDLYITPSAIGTTKIYQANFDSLIASFKV